jgi:hypothetical protein
MKKGLLSTREAAEQLAIQALGFIAADGERLGRFLALTGIGPDEIRAAAREPGFLAGILDHIAGHEDLVMAFAEQAGIDPSHVNAAREVLAGPNWEREVP